MSKRILLRCSSPLEVPSRLLASLFFPTPLYLGACLLEGSYSSWWVQSSFVFLLLFVRVVFVADSIAPQGSKGRSCTQKKRSQMYALLSVPGVREEASTFWVLSTNILKFKVVRRGKLCAQSCFCIAQGVNVTTTQNLPGGITNTRGPDYVGTSGVNIAGGSTLPGGTSESGRTNVNLTTGTVSHISLAFKLGNFRGISVLSVVIPCQSKASAQSHHHRMNCISEKPKHSWRQHLKHLCLQMMAYLSQQKT